MKMKTVNFNLIKESGVAVLFTVGRYDPVAIRTAMPQRGRRSSG